MEYQCFYQFYLGGVELSIHWVLVRICRQVVRQVIQVGAEGTHSVSYSRFVAYADQLFLVHQEVVLAVINCVEFDEVVFLFVLLKKYETAGGFGGPLLE